MKDEIQLEDFKLAFFALWKKKVLIFLVTLAGTFTGLLFTINMLSSQTYSATASVYSATYGSYQLSLTDVNAIVNYSDVVSSRKVCEYAASLIAETSVTANQIQHMIQISFSDNSYVMKITAFHKEPELAIKVVNAVAEAFVTEVSSMSGNDAVQILDVANGCYVSQTNNANHIRFYFSAGSFLISILVIALKELFSNRVRSITQCIEDEDEILGIIPDMN